MRILVIGEPCVDVIHKADGKILNEPGGISYSIAASALLNDGIRTVPVIGLRKEDRFHFDKIFTALNSLDLSGLYEPTTPVRKVDLFYEDDNRRWECSTQPIEPTPFEKIEPFLPAEGIHLNLINGIDVTLDTLRRIRSASPECHIHLDLHNIVMKHMPDGKRVRTASPDYLAWTDVVDTVQLNEEEANAIDPEARGHRQLADKILSTRARALVISLAEKGLSLYEKVNGNTMEHFFPARPTVVVDPTGSGDVFGAVFLHAVLLGKNYVEASEAGIDMAVQKVSSAGPGGLLKLRKEGADV